MEKSSVEPRKVRRIEGEAAKHRPTLWKMFKSNFKPEELTFMDIMSDMIMPAIRDGIFDIMVGTIECWRGGVGGTSYRRPSSRISSQSVRTQATNYNRISSRDDRINRNYAARSNLTSYDDIFLEDVWLDDNTFVSGVNRAKEVIKMMDEDLARFDKVRVSDFLDHCGISSSPNGSDYNYGWVNIDQVTYKPAKGGAYMIVPRAMLLED